MDPYLNQLNKEVLISQEPDAETLDETQNG